MYIFFHLAKLVLLELNEERRPGWLASELAHPRPPRADSLPPQATTGLIERLSADWSPPKVGCGALTAVPMWAAPALAAPRDFADRYDELILRGRELTEAVHISRQACGVGRVHATCAAIALESGCAIVFPSKT